MREPTLPRNLCSAKKTPEKPQNNTRKQRKVKFQSVLSEKRTFSATETTQRQRLYRPLRSISATHMSMTMGRWVSRIFTKVVRSTPNTCLKFLIIGWQSLGTSFEHCLWTFSSQSARKQANEVVNSLFIQLQQLLVRVNTHERTLLSLSLLQV